MGKSLSSNTTPHSLGQLRESVEKRLDELRQNDELPGEVQAVLDDLVLYKEILEEREQSMKGMLVDLVDDMSQASQTLTETGTRLDTILEAAEDVAFVIVADDGEHSIIEYSAGAEQIFGYERHNALGQNVGMLCPSPEELDESEPCVCSFGSHPRARVIMKRSSGESFPALYSAYPLKNNNDEVIASLIIVLDMSKREMTEKLLRESHERYRALAMASPISIITFDPNGVVTFINEWHMKMLAGGNKDPMQYLGRKVQEIPCIVRAGVADRINPVFKGQHVSIEDAHISAFGDRQDSWLNIRLSPLMHEEEFLGGILILEDVTRRKNTELHLKLLIDSSPIPLLRVKHSEEGDIIRYLNPVAQDMFGPEALDKSVNDYISVVKEADSELSAMHGDRCEVMTVDGPRQAIRASHSPTDDSEVQAVLDVGVLLEAKEAAEDASRAKSDFLANISHEIRTPLNALLGMLQLLGESDLGEEVNELTGYAMGSAQSLLALLNDILDFSVIEARALALDEQDFDLAELVNLLILPYRIEASGKGVDLDCTLEAGIPTSLYGDARRLRQIIFHVLGNAVKFTDSGSVSLDITQYQGEVEDGKIHLVFSICDTGIGMSQEQMEYIFEPFRQADGSRTRRHGGTGIGLALVHEFIAAMGGTLAVDSESGTGTEFTVTLPLTKAAPAPAVV